MNWRWWENLVCKLFHEYMSRKKDKNDGMSKMKRTQDFHNGALVIVYMLKQHKHKLKLRGMRPFVINDITLSILIQLEMLDGEPIANYINRSYAFTMSHLLMKCLNKCMQPKIRKKLMRKWSLKHSKSPKRKKQHDIANNGYRWKRLELALLIPKFHQHCY